MYELRFEQLTSRVQARSHRLSQPAQWLFTVRSEPDRFFFLNRLKKQKSIDVDIRDAETMRSHTFPLLLLNVKHTV